MTEPQTLPAENVFGIAKKMHLELEKLTLVDHGAVISMVNSMAQRRELSEKLERQQVQMQQMAAHQAANDRQQVQMQQMAAHQAANDAAMAEAKAAHDKRTAEKAAKDAGIVLVAG